MGREDAVEVNEAGSGHHALTQHEVLLLLETDGRSGLSRDEATARLGRFGPNLLPETRRLGPVARFLNQMRHPLIYILLIAGTVTLLLREYTDSAVIFGVVIINAIIGFIQESKAESALDALRAMVRTHTRVLRDGKVIDIESAELVPGDVVLLQAGDKVPADLRLLEAVELKVDESALTGESLPVTKDEVVVDPDLPVADRRNMAHSGTLVTAGTGTGVVVATGADTELGQVHRLVGSAEILATPLTRKLTWFSKVLTVVILGLAAVTFAIGVVRGEEPATMFNAAVALAVGAIPEGLPAAVTIMLAIGVNRMARRRAVIRRLPAVETLGSTTVICSDKTGTLTRNEMTIRRVWTSAGEYRVEGEGYEPAGQVIDPGERTVRFGVGDEAVGANGDAGDGGVGSAGDVALRVGVIAGVLCNDATLGRDDRGHDSVLGDPTEAAFLVLAIRAGFDLDELRSRHPRSRTLPFSSQRKFMATAHRPSGPPAANSGEEIFVKGAAEQVLEHCSEWIGPNGEPQPLDVDLVRRQVDRLAGEGLRVLAVARGVIPAARDADPDSDPDSDAVADAATTELDPDLIGGRLVFAGLVAMMDPPRRGVRAAVETCHTAGIDVKMITGDHPATALAIGRQVGIVTDEGRNHDTECVITGRELAKLDSSELEDIAPRMRVFARVSPEQKLRLVRALQRRGHVVAMTGDGVNDAPALRQADIGVAMGLSGTDVAQEAGDVVLTDDDFTTIEAAVEEGRGVFANLVKFIGWTLPTNLGEGMVILSAIIVGTTLPISPVQILWINMTTAVALGLMLAFEPNEQDVMTRPPRDPKQALLTGALVFRIMLVAAVLIATAWWVFEWRINSGASIEEARTAAVNVFVAVEAFYLLSCRSFTRSIWKLGIFSNPWIMVGIGIQLVLQLAFTYLPWMNEIFGTAPIGIDVWLWTVVLGLIVIPLVSVDKVLRRRSLDRLAAAPG